MYRKVKAKEILNGKDGFENYFLLTDSFFLKINEIKNIPKYLIVTLQENNTSRLNYFPLPLSPYFFLPIPSGVRASVEKSSIFLRLAVPSPVLFFYKKKKKVER